jgi:phage terminase large subunit
MPTEQENDLGLKGDGVERKKIKAVDDKIAELVGYREKQKSQMTKAITANEELVALFHKHNITLYRADDEKLYTLKVLEKVKRAPEPDEDE